MSQALYVIIKITILKRKRDIETKRSTFAIALTITRKICENEFNCLSRMLEGNEMDTKNSIISVTLTCHCCCSLGDFVYKIFVTVNVIYERPVGLRRLLEMCINHRNQSALNFISNKTKCSFISLKL